MWSQHGILLPLLHSSENIEREVAAQPWVPCFNGVTFCALDTPLLQDCSVTVIHTVYKAEKHDNTNPSAERGHEQRRCITHTYTWKLPAECICLWFFYFEVYRRGNCTNPYSTCAAFPCLKRLNRSSLWVHSRSRWSMSIEGYEDHKWCWLAVELEANMDRGACMCLCYGCSINAFPKTTEGTCF